PSLHHPPTPRPIYTLSLHDALPICRSIGDRLLPLARRPEVLGAPAPQGTQKTAKEMGPRRVHRCIPVAAAHGILQQQPGNIELRSEEHTSELQSRENLVCRLLLEKK